MEKKREIKDGKIVVKNPLYQELPTHMFTRRISQRDIGNNKLIFPMTLWEYFPRL